jgi:hypothetical protein
LIGLHDALIVKMQDNLCGAALIHPAFTTKACNHIINGDKKHGDTSYYPMMMPVKWPAMEYNPAARILPL